MRSNSQQRGASLTQTQRKCVTMAAMFACVAAGRLIQTDFAQLSPTQYALALPCAHEINHLVVMLTGVQPFPQGFGAVIHLLPSQPQSQPGSPIVSQTPSWTMLGILTNEKPSAIFKLGGHKVQSAQDAMPNDHQWQYLQFRQQQQQTVAEASSDQAMLGISIEPLDQVYAQQEMIRNSQQRPSSSQQQQQLQQQQQQILPQVFTSFAEILESIVDYCRSFDQFGADPAFTIRTLGEAYRKARTKTESLFNTISQSIQPTAASTPI